MKNPKSLIGRKVVAVEMNATRVRDGQSYRTMHNPTIRFDDGSSIGFVVEESPDGSGYGVDIYRLAPAKERRAPEVPKPSNFGKGRTRY